MNILSKLTAFRLALVVGGNLTAAALSSHAQSATATISGVPDGGMYDYTMVLQNTGGFALNDYWYGWTVVGNNLPSDPTVAGNSLGWDNDLAGNSIEYINNSGTPLASGQSAIFTFSSPDSPTDITTSPSGESVVYVSFIDGSQDVAGDSSDQFSPTLVATPEPSSLALAAAGGLAMAGSWRKVAAARKDRKSTKTVDGETAV